METEEYKKLNDFEKKYWWHVGRRKIIETLINLYFKDRNNLQILDAGCGAGGNYSLLKNYGQVTGLDNSPEAIAFCQMNNFSKAILGDCCQTNFVNENFDLVLALDLLEHLENENLALQEFKRILKKTGCLILTLPAYQFIWSSHDEVLKHYKRYTLFQVKKLLEGNGFKAIKISYVITILALPIILFRLLERLVKAIFKTPAKSSYILLPEFLNRLLSSLLSMEAWWLKYFNLPFGISIICVAKKND